MSATASPYGLLPVKLIGSQVYAGSIREFAMTTNSSTAIFCGDLINLTTGQPAAVTSSPTTTYGTSTPVGVCVGVRYQDPTMGYYLNGMYLPADAITNGYKNVFIQVVDDPDTIFRIQADDTVAATALGKNAPIAYTVGSTTTGRSKVALDASAIATTNTLALRIVGFPDEPGSKVGDAFTDCFVKFNQGVHAYQNATGG